MCETFTQCIYEECLVSICLHKLRSVGFEGAAQSLEVHVISLRILNMPGLILKYHSVCQNLLT